MNTDIKESAADKLTGTSSSDYSSRSQTIPAPKSAMSSGKPVYSSQNLFGSTNEIGIEHQGFFYRLRITRQGKLILNK